MRAPDSGPGEAVHYFAEGNDLGVWMRWCQGEHLETLCGVEVVAGIATATNTASVTCRECLLGIERTPDGAGTPALNAGDAIWNPATNSWVEVKAEPPDES